MYSIRNVLESKLQTRKGLAFSESSRALEEADKAGLSIKLIGSLANGKFALHSDVDFLVFDASEEKKSLAFDIISRNVKSTPFDVIYFSELTEEKKLLVTV